MSIYSELLIDIESFDTNLIRYPHKINCDTGLPDTTIPEDGLMRDTRKSYNIYYKSDKHHPIFDYGRPKIIMYSPPVKIREITPLTNNKYSVSIELAVIPGQYNDYALYKFQSLINKIDEVNQNFVNSSYPENEYIKTIESYYFLPEGETRLIMEAVCDSDVIINDLNNEFISLDMLKYQFVAEVMLEVSELVIDDTDGCSECIYNILEIRLIPNMNHVKKLLIENYVESNRIHSDAIICADGITGSYIDDGWELCACNDTICSETTWCILIMIFGSMIAVLGAVIMHNLSH